MIHESGDAVFETIAVLLDRLGPSGPYRELFGRALARVQESARAADVFLPIDLPLAVGDLVGCPPDRALFAAAASTALWSGADLMDDAADGELDDSWADVDSRDLALVTTNLLATLPHLLFAPKTAADVESALAFSQAVSRTLFVMSDGQFADFRSPSNVRSLDDYLSLVRRKSGSEFALFASAPVLLAGGHEDSLPSWVQFGFAFGTMIQVFSDTLSTISEGPHNDLLGGKRSMPVLLALELLGDEGHRSFVRDLDLASSGDHAAVERAIEVMTGTGAVRQSIEKAELLRFRMSHAFPLPLAEVSMDHPIRKLMRAYSLL